MSRRGDFLALSNEPESLKKTNNLNNQEIFLNSSQIKLQNSKRKETPTSCFLSRRIFNVIQCSLSTNHGMAICLNDF